MDISGDGKNNDWPLPQELRRSGALGQITINALLVAPPHPVSSDAGNENQIPLVTYFRALVIQGPDAFVEVAFGFEDYARAMKTKLLRELATRPVGSLSPTGDRAIRRQ